LHQLLEQHPDFQPMHGPESNILCFRYLAREDSDAFNLRLRTEYNTRGTGWITTTLLEGLRVLRVTIMNPRTTPPDLEAFVAELTETARSLH
jgi:L-2,4-diaminobutyrate decarboxylase